LFWGLWLGGFSDSLKFRTMKTKTLLMVAGMIAVNGMTVRAQTASIRLVPKNATPNEQAGYYPQSVAAGTEKLAMGSPLAVKNGVLTGAVYLFDRKTGKELPTLYPPVADANLGMQFGRSVAIAGKYIVVGAPGADSNVANLGDNEGAAYVFDINTLKLVIKRPGVGLGSEFGTTVCIDRDEIASGAPKSDTFGVDAGDCSVLNFKTGAIYGGVPPGLAAGDEFGSSLALRNGVLAVGAPGTTVAGELSAGRVYLMDSAAGSSVLASIDNPDPTRVVPLLAVGDSFGASLTFAGQRTLMIGAARDELPGGTDTGSVSFYDIFDTSSPILTNTQHSANDKDYLGTSVAGGPGVYFAGAPGADGSGVVPPADLGLVIGNLGNYGPLARGVGDEFGRAVAYADGIMIVSSPNYDGVVVDGGALWMFQGLRQVPFSGASALALVGDAAGPGMNFKGFTALSVPQDGVNIVVPSYLGSLAGAGTSLGRTQALYGWDLDLNARLLRVTGAGLSLPNSMSFMVNNVTNTVWLHDKTVAKKSRLSAVVSGVPFTAQEVGAADPVNPALTVARIFEGRADNKAQPTGIYAMPLTHKIGVGGVTADSDSAVWLSTGIEAREGGPAGFGGYDNGQLPTRMCLNGGRLIYTHFIKNNGATSANNVVVSVNATLLLRKGTALPGGALVPSLFTGETLNSAGTALVRVSLALGGGVTAANNEVLWSGRGGGEVVVRKGFNAPTFPANIVVKRILQYGIGSFDDVLALVQVGGPGVTGANDLVLYVFRNGAVVPEVLLREGDRIPGNDGATVASLLMLDTTNRTDVGPPFPANQSWYGVLASLKPEKGGATAGNNLVWMVGDTSVGGAFEPSARLPQVVLRKGATALGPVGRHVIASFSVPVKSSDVSGACNTGLPHAVSAYGGFSSLLITYPDKTMGVHTVFQPIETP
jgi:hypothetical protein